MLFTRQYSPCELSKNHLAARNADPQEKQAEVRHVDHVILMGTQSPDGRHMITRVTIISPDDKICQLHQR